MDRSELQRGLAAIGRREGADPSGAEHELRKLLEAAPGEPKVLVRLARLLHRLGRTGEAIPLMRQAAHAAPSASYLNDLGSLHLAAGERAAALEAYRQAVQFDAQYLLAKLNLADLLAETGRIEEAVRFYRQALALDPTSIDGQLGLAAALVRSGECGSAIALCRSVLHRHLEHVPALHLLAIALAKSGDTLAAISKEREALALDPQFAKGWHALGTLWDEAGDVQQAADAYRRALEIAPSLVEAAFDLAALSGDSPPAVMPQSYVTRLFDDFAANFDQRLVAELEYRIPEALREAVAAYLPAGVGKTLNVLDLGCGTGLVGRQFRDVAASIVGVDLSPAMLAKSQEANVYSELVCDDVVRYLATTERRFDLILAADLFIYIGDLRDLFAAASRNMGSAGLLAFSIEGVAGAGYVLRRTRRYAHSLAYIRELAGETGFRLVDVRDTPIRRGEEGFVDGHIVILQTGGQTA